MTMTIRLLVLALLTGAGVLANCADASAGLFNRRGGCCGTSCSSCSTGCCTTVAATPAPMVKPCVATTACCPTTCCATNPCCPTHVTLRDRINARYASRHCCPTPCCGTAPMVASTMAPPIATAAAKMPVAPGAVTPAVAADPPKAVAPPPPPPATGAVVTGGCGGCADPCCKPRLFARLRVRGTGCGGCCN